jgi:hypothetical protein
MRITASVEPSTGTTYFDGLQLEKGTVLSAFNLVENSSFERDVESDGVLDGWSINNLSMNDGLYTTASNIYVGQKSMKLTGENGVNIYVRQRVQVSGDANTQLTMSGWSMQEGADPNGGYYAMQVAINHTDGTVDYNNANDFNPSISGWQHVSADIKATKFLIRSMCITIITIRQVLHGLMRCAWKLGQLTPLTFMIRWVIILRALKIL